MILDLLMGNMQNSTMIVDDEQNLCVSAQEATKQKETQNKKLQVELVKGAKGSCKKVVPKQKKNEGEKKKHSVERRN
eukprot:m.68432 g.68432  ORF g.68432 m.68432 type:complete len:77 (-) comp12196_c1_seq1:144-374(-)